MAKQLFFVLNDILICIYKIPSNCITHTFMNLPGQARVLVAEAMMRLSSPMI